MNDEELKAILKDMKERIKDVEHDIWMGDRSGDVHALERRINVLERLLEDHGISVPKKLVF